MLHQIQSEIKAPKGQFNKFGNYKYRSCEDIVEAAKPVLAKYGFALTLTDEIVNIGNRFYVKATAVIEKHSLDDISYRYQATAWAREDETIKGMAAAQITGSASSYARKYALNGLFAIDDTKDADATHGEESDEHQNGTTLYNHKKIESNGKPLITNGQFKTACERIKKGDVDVYNNTIKTFSMSPEQLSLLTDTYNKQNQTA